jgi:uncharacterized repeat protein (TIGR01451 family)
MHRFKNRATLALLVLGSLIPLTFAGSVIAAGPPTVGLGTADSFAILAGSTITDVPASTITGDVGLSPAAGSFIGLTCAEVTGTIYSVDGSGPLPCRVTNAGLLTTAKNDLTVAYGSAAGRTPDTTFVAGDNQLGGQTLSAGVYRFGGAVTANLIGNLTLSGDASDVWIFQATSTLITAASSSVTLTGGAQACNVFWQVGTSATIATSTSFVGTIMADQSIALQTGATLQGRAMAMIAAVTLDQNTITRPACAAGVDTPADVGVVKTASTASVTVGDNVSYTSVITNHGPGVATAVAFRDALPTGETFVSVTTTQGSCAGTATVTCAIGTLGVGASATIVLVVRTTAAGTITNTAGIAAEQADQNVGANNTSSAVVRVAAVVPTPTPTPPPVAAPPPTPAPKPAAKPKVAKKVAATPTPAGGDTSISGPALPAVNPRGFTG